MPPFCAFILQPYTNLGTIEGNYESYRPIMLATWGIHVLTFLVKVRIYETKEHEEPNFGNDDDYQLQSNNGGNAGKLTQSN